MKTARSFLRVVSMALVSSLLVLSGAMATSLPASASGGWSTSVLTPPGAASGAQIAAVSRMPNTMEIWWIQGDGSIEDGYHYDGQFPYWKFFQLAPAGSGRPGGAIKAVSRASNTMEVFWEGPDESIRDASWYSGRPGTGWTGQAGIPALAPLAGFLSQSAEQPFALVSRASDTMELWWIAPDGSVQDANYYDGIGTWNYYTVAPGGAADVYGSIAGVSRRSNTWEIFWIGGDLSVQDAYWYQNGSHGRYTIAPAASAAFYGRISAISRAPFTWEIFWSGSDYSIQDSYWYEKGPSGQFTLAPYGPSPGYTDRQIGVVSRASNTMEIFWYTNCGNCSSIDHSWFYDGQSSWYNDKLSGSYGSDQSNYNYANGVTALSRASNNMEVFWVAPDGSLQNSSLYA